ncbi:MAG TPA: hypothetical protein VMV46_03270 [Thermoanaerobaculia bacterium]|nr:hypothetical protein [Thermoanaerobaculia bacterium]
MSYRKDTPDWFFPLLMRSVKADYAAASSLASKPAAARTETSRNREIARPLERSPREAARPKAPSAKRKVG